MQNFYKSEKIKIKKSTIVIKFAQQKREIMEVGQAFECVGVFIEDNAMTLNNNNNVDCVADNNVGSVA